MRESVRVLLSVKAVFFFWVSENGWLDFFFSMKNRRKKKNIAGVFREKEMKRKKKVMFKTKKKSMTGKVMYVKWLPPSLSMMNL